MAFSPKTSGWHETNVNMSFKKSLNSRAPATGSLASGAVVAPKLVYYNSTNGHSAAESLPTRDGSR